MNKKAPKRQFNWNNFLDNARRWTDRSLQGVTKHSKTFVFARWDHVRLARQKILFWLGLVLVLASISLIQIVWYSNQYAKNVPASGGTYAEGVVDKLTVVGTLYATTDTEQAVSELIYPGLLSYDSANKLNAELAESWKVDESGRNWTIKLKPNLVWSDGHALTADDVVYTVGLMKDKNINQNLANTWETIDVKATDKQTVVFSLTNSLMSFDSALTFGILPKHILEGKTPLEISGLFTNSPRKVVGSGPFTIARVENGRTSSTWTLKPNPRYNGQKSRLANFIIRTYQTDEAMTNGLKRGEVNAIANVKISDLGKFKVDSFKTIQLKTASGVYALFNNSSEITGNQAIRSALSTGLDRNQVRSNVLPKELKIPAPAALNSPIATGIYQSIDNMTQADYNVEQAKKQLDEAGWVLTDGKKYRTKGDQELTINMITIAGTNYENVAKNVADQWRKLGVNVKLESVDPAAAQQSYLIPRNYDVLVYRMHLGADPDIFAYWSSTQIGENGFNLANYNSRRAEIALSAGRTNTDPQAREERYRSFVRQWLADVPAIAFYQPSLYYVTTRDVNNFQSGQSIIEASSRFSHITDWTAQTRPTRITP